MSLFDAIILGIIEGLTEFLPISSTGHMILARPWLGVDGDSPTWHTFLFVSQMGAILAVILFYWRDLARETSRLGRRPFREHLFFKLALSLLPAGVAKLAGADNYMEAHLETNPIAVAGALIVGGVMMEIIDRLCRTKARTTLDDITWRQALFIGAIQCLAMWPGTSRSMATIMAGMVVGLSPKTATEYSFYLAIPTLLLAGLLKLYKHYGDLTADSLALMLAGSAVAFIVALLVISAFLKFVRTQRFTPFAVYRVLLGVLVLWFADRN